MNMRADTKAMIWKELRENCRWALLGFLGMCVAMAAALELDFRGFQITSWNTRSLMSPNFQFVTMIGSAGVGLALGLLQVAFDARGDRFSLLVHRPMARSAVFGAKVFAGGILYLSATLVPFLLASWWAATPGHIPAPFDAYMMLPGAVDVLIGFAYYFAGMLTGFRLARGYGRREIGISVGVAALCSVLVFAAPFWLSVLIALAGVALLGVAARGSFLSGGAFGTQPLLLRLALSVCVVIGLSFVLVLGSSALYEAAREMRWTSPLSVAYATPGRHGILPDGTVLQDRRPEDRERFQFVNLLAADSWLGRVNYRHRSPFAALHAFTGRAWFFDPAEGIILEYDAPWYTKGWGERVGFAGYVDPATLTPGAEKPARRLEYRGAGSLYWILSRALDRRELLVFSDVVYECDDRSARVLLEAAEGERFLGAELLDESGGDSTLGRPDSGHAVVFSETEVLVVDAGGRAQLRTPMPADRNLKQRIGIAELEGDRYAFYFTGLEGRYGVADSEELIRIVSARGDLLEEHRLARRSTIVPTYPLQSEFAGPALPIPSILYAGILEAPPDGYPASAVLERWYLYLGIAVSCTVAAFLLTRRFAFPSSRAPFWTGLAFVFGPVGLLTLLCLERWPARESCRSCGRERVVARRVCERCGADWPAPETDGTEIFETA